LLFPFKPRHICTRLAEADETRLGWQRHVSDHALAFRHDIVARRRVTVRTLARDPEIAVRIEERGGSGRHDRRLLGREWRPCHARRIERRRAAWCGRTAGWALEHHR